MKIERVKRNRLKSRHWRIFVNGGKCIHGVSINDQCMDCYYHIPF
ncbi:hypothetical protein VH1709_contig00011-0059 [Vibrio harveyi]|nr:hypothetical protein [Vibrio harveyi]GBK97731.1 hypothetical protein VH1709_contig00011-0059 [Vibrio harveyi]